MDPLPAGSRDEEVNMPSKARQRQNTGIVTPVPGNTLLFGALPVPVCGDIDEYAFVSTRGNKVSDQSSTDLF